jgi:CTP:molybdopterin cytidylyltransferase MocA
MVAKNAMATALEALTPNVSRSTYKILVMFGDQPEVLEAIRQARARRCSYSQIAKTLTTPNAPISETAIKSWLDAEGID